MNDGLMQEAVQRHSTCKEFLFLIGVLTCSDEFSHFSPSFFDRHGVGGLASPLTPGSWILKSSQRDMSHNYDTSQHSDR